MTAPSMMLALIAFAGTMNAAAAAESPPRPNVVLIMADDLGYGDFGCYGATKIATPHCDRLAREGRRFTDAHTPSAVCSPTRFGLLSGGYPWREGRVPKHLDASDAYVFRDGEATLASLLKAAGYATGCIGKWHLGAQRKTPIDWNAPLVPGPRAAGFDAYFGVINSHNQAPFVLVENEAVLGARADRPIRVSGNVTQESGPQSRDSNRLEQQQSARAVAFIDEHHTVPFFLYYPTAAVHNPLTPGEAYSGTSSAGVYGDYVQEFDGAVGAVLDALDRHRIADRTIVIVTSDNGGVVKHGAAYGHAVNGALRGQKTTVWERGHRVPFLVRWPGRVPAGTVCDETICHVDVMATLCAALGIELPADAGPDSWNVLPVWLGEPHPRPLREATICVSQSAAAFAIRRGPWKLLLNLRDDVEPAYRIAVPQLYHLGNDLAEQHDRAAEHPELVEELTSLLRRYREQAFSRPGWRVE